MPETVPLDFTDYDVMWVASKLFGAVGVMGEEAIELRNWLLCFGCASEDLMVVVSRRAEFRANPTPPPGLTCIGRGKSHMRSLRGVWVGARNGTP